MSELLVSSNPALKRPPDDRKTGCLVQAAKHSHCRVDGLSSVVFVEESLEKFLDVIYLFTWCCQNVTVGRRGPSFLSVFILVSFQQQSWGPDAGFT